MRLTLIASVVASIVASSLALGGTASALPNPDARFRPGANHHLGDGSFVARFGRRPTAADDEHVRMKLHLEFVRAWLAARPATAPELAARRGELLGYLDDYVARGVTPSNAHLPWRTAVFIDDAGAIYVHTTAYRRDGEGTPLIHPGRPASAPRDHLPMRPVSAMPMPGP